MIVNQRACVVQIGKDVLGIVGAYTRQVHGLTTLRRTPRTATALLGLFAVRSQVLPIVALEPLLHLAIPKHEFAVQLEFEGRSFGVGIDAALGFVAFEPANLILEARLEPICLGGMRFQNSVIPLLNLPKILEQLAGVFAPQSSPSVFVPASTPLRVLS